MWRSSASPTVLQWMRHVNHGLPIRGVPELKAPGTFSQARNRGRIKRAVLPLCTSAALISFTIRICSIKSPERWPWQFAGRIILGTSFSLAWRVMDVQHWGLAQRRARIFLIADFGGLTAPHQGERSSQYDSPSKLPWPGVRSRDRNGIAINFADFFEDDPEVLPLRGSREAIDLGETAGALMATNNMQMQTFVTAFATNQRDEVRDLHDPV